MRQQFPTRTIRLVGATQRDTAIKALQHVPLDPERPIELVLREERKARGLDQNAAMWAGPLKDIADQAWVDGRQYSAEVWHEYFKREYLPEEADEELTKEGYRKWDIDPSGGRVLVGSTTQLTRKGMGVYLKQIEAHGADLGVLFSARAA